MSTHFQMQEIIQPCFQYYYKIKMSNRIPLPIKFSNLLQANPESCLYGLDLTTTSNLQHGNIIVEKIKRKSVNLGSLKSKRAVESFSPQNETSKIQNLINKSKIKRLLFEANFDKSDISNAKKKKMYVIRKRQEKSRLGKQKMSQTQNNQQQISLTKYQQNSLRVNTQPSDKIFQQIFKIKRKVPKFGIQDIAPKIALRKHSLYTKKTPDLFSSTSSNSFYNTSFYMNSKIKQALSAKQQARIKINQLSPQIKNLIPHPINNDRFLEKKKQLQKFYTTNFGSFGFSRSKTQEIQPNMICGWQKQSSDNQNYTEGLN